MAATSSYSGKSSETDPGMEVSTRMKRLAKPLWQKKMERRRIIWMIGLLSVLLVPLGVGSAYILSKTFLRDAGSAALTGDIELAGSRKTGDTIFVRRGESFQKALNIASPGDTILLEAGATYKGSFKLPRKVGEQFITIRTSALDAKLPAANKRIEPGKYAFVLPKLESNQEGKPVIFTEKGAHHYRFVGVEFMPTIKGLYNIIRLGDGDETRIEDLPHHIEFDRVYIHGSELDGQRRGIAANGRHIKIINSHISNIKKKGQESQAIAAWATDGPIFIENNYLEAAGMSILFGGADAPLRLTPADCFVSRNHISKRLEWKGQDWVVKNLFEIKNGKNIKVQNNLMTNNWLMGQDGTAILFTVREDSGEGAYVEDIDLSNNIIRGSGNAVNIYGSEGRGGRNIVIRNNIFDDIDHKKWGGNGFFLKATEWKGLTIENNTIIQSGNITSAYGAPVSGFIFRNNIIFNNEYGFFGDDYGAGKAAVKHYFPGASIENNVIIGGDPSDYGSRNYYPASVRQIGFTDMKSYRLPAGSPFRTRGAGGKIIGADLDPNTVGGN